jgi:hypothetical protein
MLVNSIQVTTVVTVQSGMQVSTSTFTSSAGDLGVITLSPVEPIRTGVTLGAGSQVLKIHKMTFQAAFGFDQGYVFCEGSGTNQEGTDSANFSKNIAGWSAS